MKKSFKIFVILLFSLTIKIYSQNIILKIDGLCKSTASLYSLELGFLNQIGKTVSDNNGKFLFIANKLNLNIGLYRIFLESNEWFDIIFDRNDIEIHSTKNNLRGNFNVIKSKSNILYYSFLSLHNIYKRELNKLILVTSQSEKNQQEFEIQKGKFEKIKKKYKDFLTTTTNKNSFVSRYIKSMQTPILKHFEKVNIKPFLIKHSLDNVDFNDVGLINSDVFVNKAIELIGYYTDPKFSKIQQKNKYITAIDDILNKAKVNELVYHGIVEFLIEGFKKLNFLGIIDYIVENYVLPDDLCIDSQTDNSIQMRIDQAKYFKKGVIVPNIILPDSNGRKISLFEIKAKVKLILFYSSSCSHCKELMPQIKNIHDSNKNDEFEILGISLDNDFDTWVNYIKKNNLTWTNISDLMGWKSETAYDYFIYATPTMFLVDKNNRLIGKVNTFEKLNNFLKTEFSQLD